MYPKWKYHPEKEAVIVASEQQEKELGKGWVESPADYGVETTPGEVADEVIASKGSEKKSGSKKPSDKVEG